MLKPGYLKYRTIQYLRHTALEKRWLGRADYTRFILLGRSRVGSNMLRGLLNAHSQIVLFGEIFQNKDEIGWAMEGFPSNGRTQAMFRQQPAQLLEQKLWRNYPEQITAVGFKLFYYHARDAAWAPVWDYLRQNGDLRILHLKRRNLLQVHLSRKRAMLSSEWVRTAAAPAAKAGAVALDYAECLADFEQTRAWERQAETFFRHHTQLELIYEEVAANTAGEMGRVQQFLGAAQEAVQPQTHKQLQRPLAEAIANYDELKAQFSHSPWAVFFEE